jgi:putative pyruvate formate lyase activating enzyme
MRAAYLDLHETGELDRRAEAALAGLRKCEICPRKCRVNRAEGRRKTCGGGAKPKVSSHEPHFGEESALTGKRGSGTIFFAGCNLNCLYCQNYDISIQGRGGEVQVGELADMMLELQELGCHNINLVTPTHFTPQIIDAVRIAAGSGLVLPLVYNCGGYESVETLRLLDGIVDIYMPDIKYSAPGPAGEYSKAPDYFNIARAAIIEMQRQVGVLQIDDEGIAARGLLVRHLVLPGGLAGSGEAFKFLAEEISRETYVNVMDQYRPCHSAHRHPPLDRRITAAEYGEAVGMAVDHGLSRLDGMVGARA